MSLLVLALISLILSGICYVRMLSWLSIIGYCLAIAVWVISTKAIQYDSELKFVKPAKIISIIATIANFIGILLSFVLFGLFYGGFVTF